MVQELGDFTRNFLKDLESKLIDLRERHKAELIVALRRTNFKNNDSFHHGKGLLPLERLKDKKILPTR